jgi:hypothetical protein
MNMTRGTVMQRIAMAVVLLAGCAAPVIEPYCEATEDGVECSFTNMGGTGSSCVEITLARKDGGGSTRTDKPVCSGEIGKSQTANVSGRFVDPQPSELCKNSEGVLSWNECTLKVRTIK